MAAECFLSGKFHVATFYTTFISADDETRAAFAGAAVESQTRRRYRKWFSLSRTRPRLAGISSSLYRRADCGRRPGSPVSELAINSYYKRSGRP